MISIVPNYCETESGISRRKEYPDGAMYWGELNGNGLRHGFGFYL